MADRTLLKRFSLNHISLATRIILLFIVPITVLGIVAALATKALNDNETSLYDLQSRVENINFASHLIIQLNDDYRQTLMKVHNGTMTWADGREELLKAETQFDTLFSNYDKRYQNAMVAGNAEVGDVLKSISTFETALQEGQRIFEAENRAWLELFITNDMETQLKPLEQALQIQKALDVESAQAAFINAKNSTRGALISALVTVSLGSALAMILGYFIYRSIVRPTRNLSQTVQRLSEGDLEVRAQVTGTDELAKLSQALNQLLEERMSTIDRIDHDHQELNHSVMNLLQAVSELSDRNLTVRAKVTEDATGPLADAINQLAEDTAEVLLQVQDVAEAVEHTSQEVNQHTASVNKIASVEQNEAHQTAAELNTIVERLDSIAESAKEMNKLAGETANSTETATRSVSHSLESMQDIRQHTQETGKRIKRLGERSQEITHIVEIINTIAERTTVLALNASMQAASAGEAGRGFSVVAEEIQRLAENSRESTNQIAALIRNIQLETNETIRTMDRTIEEVVEGSKLAEAAGQEMQRAQEATSSLVSKVGQISNASQQQAEISKSLQNRAKHIVDATLATGERLRSQSLLTESMEEYAHRLAQSVRVFRLEAS